MINIIKSRKDMREPTQKKDKTVIDAVQTASKSLKIVREILSKTKFSP
jgi:hypothetical protein